MQTLLPYPDFSLSVCCLDDERLDKQCREALTIYQIVTERKKGWNTEPACKMWLSYPSALAWYFNCALSHLNYKKLNRSGFKMLSTGHPIIFPHWVGDWKFHHSHQSSLLRKNEAWYRIWFGPSISKNLDLVWPTERRIRPR